MGWKCSCKQNNEDNNQLCINCGRKRPVYLGIKIDLNKNELTQNQIPSWYLRIADSYLEVASNANESIKKLISEHGMPPYKEGILNGQFEKLKNAALVGCVNCYKFIEEADKINPEAQFTDKEEVVFGSNTLKSLCYFEFGLIEYRSMKYAKALEYFQSSFKAEPNQISIFHLALSTMNLPLEGGSFFSGKKTEEAISNKKIQEIELLKKTIQFAPYSILGIKAATILFENYNVIIKETDF